MKLLLKEVARLIKETDKYLMDNPYNDYGHGYRDALKHVKALIDMNLVETVIKE